MTSRSRPAAGQSPPLGRAFRGLVVSFGISAVGFGAMAPFLVVWGHRDAGLSGTAAGLLFVAQAAGELTGGLAGGLIADRVGGRQVLLVSTLGMALGYGSLTVVTAPVLAIIVIFLAGLFEAAYHPTAFALVGDLKPTGDRAQDYGVIRTAGNLGTILGPLAGAAVVAGASIADVFVVSGALLAVSGLVVLATLPRRGLPVSLEEEAEEIQAAVPGVKAIARDRRLALLVGGGALLTITLAWWEADGLAIVATQRPFGASGFALMLALTAAITVIFQIPVSRLTRGRPVATLLAVGAGLQAVGLAALAAASLSLAVIIAAITLIAFGQMLYAPNINALVSTIAPRGRGVTYQAAISVTQDIGMAAGPASGLALGASIGAPLLWLLALPLGLLAGAATARAATAPRPRSVPEPGELSAPPEPQDASLS
jgi:MFS family permease